MTLDPSSFVSLAGFVGVCFLAACSGAIFRPGEWYERLDKPGWTPANWVFPVVWTVLYVMVAVSGWLVWEAAGMAAREPLIVYLVSLGLNALWSAVFFGMRRIGLALVEVAFLWGSIALMIALFAPISIVAALLLVPYLVWVSIATALNLSVWRLNRRRLATGEI